MRLYDAPVAPRLDGLAVGTLSEQQSECAEDDALAGTGLAGDDGEAPLKGDVEHVDEGEVLDI